MSRKRNKKKWDLIQQNISQGPCQDPKLGGMKALSQVKQIKQEAFLPKTPIAQQTQEKTYLTIFVFHPQSFIRMIWDITAMLLIIYQAITVPFRICFNVPITGGWTVFEFIISLVFMMDMVITLNTGFYLKGALVMNRKKIAKNYLKFWFWLDLIASIPYTWIIDGVLQDESTENQDQNQSIYRAPQLLRLIRIFRFLRILKLLRLAKLKKILIKIQDYIASNTLATMFVFFRLLSVVFFIAHWTACWWFYIGSQGMADHPVTWVTGANIENKDTYQQYITALYWAFTTMTTVGYGDIYPYTISQKIYAMFSMIVACGVFAYTVGSIGSLVSKQNAVQNAYREQVVAVNRYMRKKDLPHDLQFRVRRYLEYVWENKKRNNLDEKQILSLLSEPLRDDIYAHIHGVVIKLCPIFEQYEAHFISQLTRTLESQTYAPGDTVIEQGEMSSKMYFIQNGKIEIFHQMTKSPYRALGPKEYFGEIALFTQRPRCASAKCLDFVDLLSLSRSNMNLLLQKFPQSKQTTERIIKKCEDGDYSSLLINCYVCKQLGHVAIRCRKILLNLNNDQTRKKWLDKRTANKTKYISSREQEPVNLNRMPKIIPEVRINSRNIIGMPRPAQKMYPHDQHLHPKIKGYIQQYLQGHGDSYSTTSGTSGNGTPHVLRNNQRVKNRPRYTMIYKESENSDQEKGNQDTLDVRPHKVFRTSLLKDVAPTIALAPPTFDREEEKFNEIPDRINILNSHREIPFLQFEGENDKSQVQFDNQPPSSERGKENLLIQCREAIKHLEKEVQKERKSKIFAQTKLKEALAKVEKLEKLNSEFQEALERATATVTQMGGENRLSETLDLESIVKQNKGIWEQLRDTKAYCEDLEQQLASIQIKTQQSEIQRRLVSTNYGSFHQDILYRNQIYKEEIVNLRDQVAKLTYELSKKQPCEGEIPFLLTELKESKLKVRKLKEKQESLKQERVCEKQKRVEEKQMYVEELRSSKESFKLKVQRLEREVQEISDKYQTCSSLVAQLEDELAVTRESLLAYHEQQVKYRKHLCPFNR